MTCASEISNHRSIAHSISLIRICCFHTISWCASQFVGGISTCCTCTQRRRRIRRFSIGFLCGQSHKKFHFAVAIACCLGRKCPFDECIRNDRFYICSVGWMCVSTFIYFTTLQAVRGLQRLMCAWNHSKLMQQQQIFRSIFKSFVVDVVLVVLKHETRSNYTIKMVTLEFGGNSACWEKTSKSIRCMHSLRSRRLYCDLSSSINKMLLHFCGVKSGLTMYLVSSDDSFELTATAVAVV